MRGRKLWRMFSSVQFNLFQSETFEGVPWSDLYRSTQCKRSGGFPSDDFFSFCICFVREDASRDIQLPF